MDENTAANAAAEPVVDVGSAADTINPSDSAGDTSPVEGANIESEPVQTEQPKPADVTKTQAFAHRLKAETQKARDAAFAEMYNGTLLNGNPILTESDARAFKSQQEAERQRQSMIDAGYNPDAMAQAYNFFKQSDPEIQQFRKIAADMQAERGRVQMQEQMKAISAIDPSVKTIEDLAKMPTFSEFDQKVKQGYSMIDAYMVVNFDSISAKRTAAAKQAAINAAQGKAHMQPTGGTTAGEGVQVPPDVYAEYKLINPTATDAEIRAHYARVMKG